jgi:exopolysaccharide biosynthesis polyprenyl glycosylphosphotransferase
MYSSAILLERLQLSLLRLLATVVAAMAATWIRHGLLDSGRFLPWVDYLGPALIAGALVAILLWALPARSFSRFISTHAIRVTEGVAAATIIVLALSFFYRSESYSRATVVIFLPLAVFAILVADTAQVSVMRRMRTSPAAARRALLVGYDDYGRRVARALAADPAYLEVVGYIADDARVDGSNGNLQALGTLREFRKVIASHQIDTVIIASGTASADEIQSLVGQCMAAGVHWTFVPPMLGLLLDRVHVDQVGGLPLVSGRGDRLVGHAWFIKRAFDVVLAGLALLLVSPFMAIAALGIRLESPGPVIFRQQRIGMDEKPFTLLKFRTMTHGADTGEHQEYSSKWILGRTAAAGEGRLHKLQGDARITRLGRFLRATSFDEIPQLWNVVRGDMSLVGPRPPISYEVEQYTEWHRRRLSVPPGVTGLWQVTGRNSVSFDEMVRMDLDYIEDWSLGLDIRILLRTVPALMWHRGS